MNEVNHILIFTTFILKKATFWLLAGAIARQHYSSNVKSNRAQFSVFTLLLFLVTFDTKLADNQLPSSIGCLHKILWQA